MKYLWIAAALVAVVGIGSCERTPFAPNPIVTQSVPEKSAHSGTARYVYVVDRLAQTLLVYPAGVENPAPVRTVSFDSQPIAVATNDAGQVYVTCWNSTVEVFGSGAASRLRTLKRELSGLNEPSGIVFDGAGNLWIANRGNPSFVAEYDPTTFAVMRSVALPPRYLASGVAVDGSGSLWVDMMPMTGGGYVAEYSAPGYGVTKVLVTAGNGGLAFDARGYLRVGTISNLLTFAPPAWKRVDLGYYGQGYDIWRLTARNGILYVPMASHGTKPSQVLEIDTRSAALPIAITRGFHDPEGAAAGI